MIYLDTSAALKLVTPEAETAALELWITERAGIPRVSSRLLRIEMLRTVARNAPHRMNRANAVLSSVALVSMDDIASTAEVIGDRMLRSLDALHLATAHELRADLTAFVCYDKRLGDSAQALGLPVEAPALPNSRATAASFRGPPRPAALKIFYSPNGAAAHARVGGDFCHERAT